MEKRPHYLKNRLHPEGRRFPLWLLLAGLCLVVTIWGRPFAAFGDNRLFIPIQTSSTTAAMDFDAATRRARPVQINFQALNPNETTIRLNLFDDLNLTATRHRIDKTITGGYVWVGQIVEHPGTVTLSVQNRTLAGSVELVDGRRITVKPLDTSKGAAHDRYIVREVNSHAPEPNGPDTILPAKPAPGQTPQVLGEASCQEDGSVIDVMVMYTTAARVASGGTDAIEALISQLVSEMNTANQNSQAPFAWRLVAAGETAYVESGNLSDDLTNLQMPGDGLLDEVHALRDAANADLVSLLVAEGNNNMCGIAFQLTGQFEWFEAYAFSIAALDYPGNPTCSQLTMAHEFGHTMGNTHDRDHANLKGIFDYSYGYQSTNEAARFRDIMAYDCPGGCPRINHWANPSVFYLGEPTGIDHEVDQANSADLVRSMNGSRKTVANFRANCVTTPEATDTPISSPSPTMESTVVSSLTPTATMPPSPTSTPGPTATPTNPPATASPQPSPTVMPSTTTPPIERVNLPIIVRP